MWNIVQFNHSSLTEFQLATRNNSPLDTRTHEQFTICQENSNRLLFLGLP